MASKEKVLLEIADNDELLEVARKAVEDELIAWRDSRLSQLLRRNGLVVAEANGDASSVIRFGAEHAIKIGLRAIAKHIASHPGKE